MTFTTHLTSLTSRKSLIANLHVDELETKRRWFARHRRSSFGHVRAMELDDQADNQMAKMRQKQPKKMVKGERRFRKQMRELVGLMPDLQAEESLLDDADHLWESAAQLNSWNSGEWDGVDGGGGGGLGLNVGALSSLPMSESSVLKEESGDESTNSSPERLPSYRANRKMPGYSRPLSSIQASLPSLQVMEERSPEELAREDYLMDLAVDAGMELHHARLERAQSRYAMALAYAEVLENIEMEDARSQMAPLLEGTNLKMPSWIRASEQLVPYLDGINEAVAKAEIEDNERELQRIQNSIIDEVDEAIRMLIETDPGASIAALPPTTLPPMESLDDLFGDEDTLLPGVSGDDGAQESLNNILDGLDGLPDATMLPSLSGLGSSTSIVESALQALSKDFELGIEESELEDIQPRKRKTTGRTLGGSGYGEGETSEEEDDQDGDDFEDDWPSGGRLLKD